MRLSLIATPHTHPTCPPLGVAVLSAYIQQGLPETTVSVFDLSLKYYLKSFQIIKDGSFGIRLYKWDEKTTAHNLEQAVSFLKNWQPDQVSLQEYHQWATIFLSFENVFNAFMTEMAKKALTDQAIPGRIMHFFEELIQPVLAAQPDLIGFSILYEQQLVFAALLAKLIKRQSSAKIVVGGAQVSVMVNPENLLCSPFTSKKDAIPELFGKDFFDYLIPGEGELGLYHLCQSKSDADLADVPNLIYFEDDALRINPPGMVEMESLPYPDFSQFKLDQYLTPEPVLPLMTSRGCPWGKCSFCTHHHSYLHYRTRSIEVCVEEIKFLQKEYDCSLFYFYDEMIPPMRFQSLATRIIEEELTIHYGAYAKPVKSFTSDLCELLQRTGCQVLQWGVEAASQRVLDLMSKGTDIHEVEKVLKNAAGAGMYNLVFVLFGFPSETVEEFEQTLALLERNQEYIHALSSGTFVMTEGSQIHREPEKFSISSIVKRPNTSNLYPVLNYTVCLGMTEEEVRKQFTAKQSFLDTIPLSPRLGTYREHLLVYGARHDSEVSSSLEHSKKEKKKD